MKSSTIKITFLGTGTSQGIPVIGSKDPVCLSTDFKDKRLRTSAYIETEGTQILIDCGPDFRQQMLQNNFSKLDAILFTHEHNDHVVGLDDVRPIFFERQKNIELFGLERVLFDIKKRFPYSFDANRIASVAGFNLNILDGLNFFSVNNIKIEPIPVLHGSLPILAYRIKNLAYMTDTSQIPEESMQKLQGVELLVINALWNKKVHPNHFNLSQAIEIIEKINPKKAFITHISYHMGFHEEVQKNLPENIFLAYDGMQEEC